jgi:predicted phage terminase large subunit-like protein
MSPTELRAYQRRIMAEKCRRDLHLYAQKVVWPIVEGSKRQFKDNWHLHAIADHLQAVARNEIRNLLINLPPRFMKSLLISVGFPTWIWLDSPELQFITASYAKDLAVRDAVKSRRVIDSPFYQENYGDIFQMSTDQNVKQKYENDHNGHRIATSVGGIGTGEGGDFILCDDPHNVLEGESDTVRGETLTWWSETMSTRLNDPATGHRIIIMQRVHALDLSGFVLEQGGYEHLFVPMRYEEGRTCVTVLGNHDPRTKENELAWPERFPEEEVALLEKTMGPYAIAGQFQQTPGARGGALFNVDKIQVVAAAPAGLKLVRGWDLAATEEKVGANPAWTAGVLMGIDRLGRIFICDVVRERLGPLAVETAITGAALKDGKRVRISMPQDPGAAGKIVGANYVSKLKGYIAKATPETGSKLQRAEPFAAQVEAGNVFMVAGTWNHLFKEELKTFPAGAFKDQVDAASRAFAELIEMPTGADNIIEYYKQLAARLKATAAAVGAEQDRTDTPGASILAFTRSFGNG